MRRTVTPLWLLVAAACGGGALAVDPIFIEGRAVAASGDSIIATTRAGHHGIIVRPRRAPDAREVGGDALQSPWQIQWLNGDWYVSDVENGKPFIVVLGADGRLRRRVPLGAHTTTPHQFAVLPDGRIVVESPEAALVALSGDSSSVFAVTERSSRTGLLVGAAGGVLHAIPDRYITLYNEFGHVRWRLDWPWASTAYVTDIAVDPQGRIHVLAGVPRDSTFIVYSLSNQTGEVVIWSNASRQATFVVDRLGQIKEGEAEDWLSVSNPPSRQTP